MNKTPGRRNMFSPHPTDAQSIITHGEDYLRYLRDRDRVPKADSLYEKYTNSLKHKQNKLAKNAKRSGVAGKILLGGSLATGIAAGIRAAKKRKEKNK